MPELSSRELQLARNKLQVSVPGRETNKKEYLNKERNKNSNGVGASNLLTQGL